MVSLSSAEHLHDACQQPFGSGSHIDRFDSQPHRVDADHRSSSRSHAAHSAAAVAGQVTTISVAPRCNSIRTSLTGAGEGSGSGTNLAGGGLTAFGGHDCLDIILLALSVLDPATHQVRIDAVGHGYRR